MNKMIVFTLVIFLLNACTNETNVVIDNVDSTVTQGISYPNGGDFYLPDTGSAVIVANPIICDVIVKNNDPSDDWAEYCLENTDIAAISNIIYNAIYQGRLTAYHYLNDSIFSIEQVKEIERNNSIDNIGKIQFDEQWYFDETNLTMSKKVNSIIFGYQLVNDDGDVYGYKPSFKVYFDQVHNVNPTR